MKTTAVLLVLGLCLAACGDEPSTVADAFPVPSWAKVAPEQIAEAKKHGVPVAFENDLGMRFVLIPAGTFRMGASPEEQRTLFPRPALFYDRELLHEVKISKPFYIQMREVTNAAYRQLDAEHHIEVGPALLRLGEVWGSLAVDADDYPVTLVSHDDARYFPKWLSIREGSRTYRLPTEAQWEYACRAGTGAPRYWGSADTTKFCNTADTSLRRAVDGDPSWTTRRPGWPISDELLWLPGDDGFVMSAPVATFPPNAWGLHDMLGNVSEWCADWYGPYPDLSVVDPVGVSSEGARSPQFPMMAPDPAARVRPSAPPPPPPRRPGDPEPRAMRVTRGGSWMTRPTVRAAAREPLYPDRGHDAVGFRLVSPLPEPAEK